MHCDAHPGTPAAARCTRCGTLLCADCRERESGRAVCRACAAGPQPPVRRSFRVFPAPPAQPLGAGRQPGCGGGPAVACASPEVAGSREVACGSQGIAWVSVEPARPRSPIAPPVISVRTRPRRWPRPWLAGALGAAPGLGHVYALRPLRGLLAFGAAVALAPKALALGGGALAAYVFGHGLVAWDGYRQARLRHGTWTDEDAREARGVWLACAGALLLLSLARAGGATIPVWATVPAVLVPLGVGLALGERSNRTARLAGVDAPGVPLGAAASPPSEAKGVAPAPSPAPVPTPPAAPTGPGAQVDRRADRAELASQLVA